MLGNVAERFQNYMGSGLIIAWFLVCLVYLWANEKRKNFRILFLYAPVTVLLLFFNPLFAWIVYHVTDDEIYYRLLWLLPVTPVIAYTCVSVYGRLSENRGKAAVFLFSAAAAVILSGSLIYQNPHFIKAQNRYHMPDSVVRICDGIIVPGREVMAAFPPELVQFVRQYTPLVCMPYGREMFVDAWRFENDMYDLMGAEVIDLAALNQAALEEQCHYVILRDWQQVDGDFADCEWELYFSTDGYSVYRVTGYPLEVNW